VTLEEAKEISYSPYAIIAPHGYRHTRLSTLTNSQLEIDIKKTIHIFTENNFNRDFFAIPFGRIGYDFSMRDILLIKKYGLKPLSMSPIAITHSERQLVIPRIGLGIGDQHLWLEKACGAGRLWKFFKEPRLK
jgi:peptidoglycan/xylan/chitin deacetylase (PgdA/CDA1 family)